MSIFRDFTFPLWELFGGNALFLICSLFYLAWWTVSFRPNTPVGAGSGIYITITFVTGISAIVLMLLGIYSLSQTSTGIPLLGIVLGGAAAFLVLIVITSVFFQRRLTSELLIILIWAVLEICIVAALNGVGRLDIVRTILWIVLVGVATLVGLVCYVIHYRLDEMGAYWNGMIPLAIDALMMAVFLGLQAFS